LADRLPGPLNQVAASPFIYWKIIIATGQPVQAAREALLAASAAVVAGRGRRAETPLLGTIPGPGALHRVLFSIPIGTAIGAYPVRVLAQGETAKLFASGPNQ
jgi:hypothetical protein